MPSALPGRCSLTELYKNVRIEGRPACVLVRDGRIAEVTHDGEPPSDRAHDLGGIDIVPGFVDAHCHVLPTGFDLQSLNLSTAQSRQEVLDAVRDALQEGEPGRWLRAVHYDQNRFADGRHLTRDELDALSAETPILLRHSSGHASVANSAALREAGVAEDVADPVGGAFERGADGRLTGVLLETAHERVTSRAPAPTHEEMVAAILRAGEAMSAVGVVAAADMMTGRWGLGAELAAYREAAARGCRIVVRLYVQWRDVFGPRAPEPERLREWIAGLDSDRVAVRGVKIFADGAIGAGTAAIYGRYATPAGGDGALMYAPDVLASMVARAHEAGWAVATHAIGDRAVDHVLDAYEGTGEPSRHRLEHAMLLSQEQIARIARLGVFVVTQPEFLTRFGHVYRRQLGPERSATLKPHASLLRGGVSVAFSSDRPIVPGAPVDGLRVAVRRPEGFDPAENVDAPTAPDAYTRRAAEVCGDAGYLGTFEPGALFTWAERPSLG